jgi:hypothetical protein
MSPYRPLCGSGSVANDVLGDSSEGWLGHSTGQTTADVYGHLFPETNDLVIGGLDKALRTALPHPSNATTTIDRPDGGPPVRRLRPGT